MIEILTILQGILERGLIFGIVVMAVYLASRLINFDNLAIEGAFGLGAAMTGLLINCRVNPWLALFAAMLVGGLSGIVTGLLNTKLKLNNLISGIVVTTGLFSIILKIAGSNLALSGKSTIFSQVAPIFGSYKALLILTFIILLLLILIEWLLKTEIGLLLQAVGHTPQMLTNIGKSVDYYIILGLTLSNSLAALSGGLFVQYAGYFSIWTSVGVLITGLAGLILAQIFNHHFGVALVIGAILYQAVIALTFELQLDQDWNKLITALLIVVLIMVKQMATNKEEPC